MLPTLSVRYSTRPPLNSATALPTSMVTVPGLRVGHEAPGAEDPAERSDLAHEVRGGDGHVEVQEALVPDPGDQVVGADDVGTGAPGLGGLLAGGEHGHPHVRPVPDGKRQRAPDDLVGLAGVDPEPHGQLDGLVELGRGQLLDQLDGLGDAVQGFAVDLGRRLACTSFRAGSSSCPSGRRSVAGSAGDGDAHGAGGAGHLLLGRSRSSVLRSGSLILAMSASWASVTVPTCSRPGVADPLSRPAAWRSSTGVGGVFRTKVKLRSS